MLTTSKHSPENEMETLVTNLTSGKENTVLKMLISCVSKNSGGNISLYSSEKSMW